MRQFLLVSLLLCLAVLLVGCFSNNKLSLFPQDDEEITTRLVKDPTDDSTDDRILILDIEGVISEYGRSSMFYDMEPTTAVVRRKLEKAERDERIKAVILRINSPGGTATGADIVYHDILKYKDKTKVPIVAAIMGTGASGGYYLACTGDTILAHETSITGSIGVIIHYFGFSGLFEKIGMESRVIMAGAMKDVGNPFREMTDEDRAVFQKIVDQAYQRFISVVEDGRPNLSREQILKIADGSIYSGKEAEELGLVDKLGDLDDAIEEAKRLAKIRDAGVILYTTNNKPQQNIYSLTRSEAPKINIDAQMIDFQQLAELSRPQLLFMWLGY